MSNIETKDESVYGLNYAWFHNLWLYIYIHIPDIHGYPNIYGLNHGFMIYLSFVFFDLQSDLSRRPGTGSVRSLNGYGGPQRIYHVLKKREP